MNDIQIYFTALQDKIYKLLPMREDYDAGQQNYLPAYVKNLFHSLNSYKNCHPALERNKSFVDVYSNVAMLRDVSLPFDVWRSAVLRSTRLAGEIALNGVVETEKLDA